MKKMKYILYLLLLTVPIFGQGKSEFYFDAMRAFTSNEFIISHYELAKIKSYSDVANDLYSSGYFYSAEALFKEGQTNGAAAEYERFIRQFPNSNYRNLALFRLGLLYFDSKQYERARSKLILLIRESPNSEYFGAANYWVGESFIAERKLLEAEDFLLESLTMRDKNTMLDYSIYSLGNIYEMKGDFNKAVSYYDELLAYYSSSELAPYAQLRIGISYFKLNQYESTILELTDKLILILPNDLQIEANYVLAMANFRLKKYADAEDIFQKILDLSPENISRDQIKYGLAWVNFQTSQFDAAYKLFNELAVSIEDSIRIKSLYWSGESKRYAGKISDAIKIYNTFLNLYPNDPTANSVKFNLGIVYYNKKNFRRAEEVLLEASETSNHKIRSRALNLLGEINLNSKKYSNAKMYFEQSVAEFDKFNNLLGRSLLGLGITEYYRNAFVSAINALTKLQELNVHFEEEKVNFYLAESYFAKGDFAKSRDFYNNIAPTSQLLGDEALLGRGYSYFNLKDFANSAYYFKEFTNRFPNHAEIVNAKLRLADSYFGTKNFDLASLTYKDVFYKTKVPINQDFEYYQFAQALYYTGESQTAIREFRNLQIRFPNSKYSDDAQYFLGWIYFKDGDFATAISEYMKIGQKYRNSDLVPMAYYSIGDSYYNLAQYDEAISFYRTVLEEFPKSRYVFDAVNGMQYCFIAKGVPEEAIMFINNFVALNPTSEYGDQILFKKGEIYFNLGNYENAKVGYKEFIATYPKSRLVPDAYFWIGKCSKNLNQLDDAIYNFNIISENYWHSEMYLSSVIELGSIHRNQKQIENELAVYNKTIAEHNDIKGIEEIIFLKAMAQIKLNNYNSAYETLNQLVINYDRSIFADKAKVELGLLELARGSYEIAERLFREIGNKRKDDIGAKAQYFYGYSLFERGVINDAIPALVRVRSVFAGYDEWYTRSLLTLGDCYTVLMDKKNARDMFRAVIKKHRNDQYGKEAKLKLRKL